MVSRFVFYYFFILIHNINAWNPNNYPYLPAIADTSNIRKKIIDDEGSYEKILDIGCGLGYSTSDSPGCLGIDLNKNNVKKAKKIFPNKKFRHSFMNAKYPEEDYDIITSMFFFHEIPREIRKILIKNAVSKAKKRVVIVDIDPSYDVTLDMKKNKPYLNDYFQTIREDLKNFNEITIEEGVLTKWVYDKENHGNIITSEFYIEDDNNLYKENDEIINIRELIKNNKKEQFLSKDNFIVNGFVIG